MSNPSNVIQGESYFAKVYEAVPDYNEKQSPGTGKYQWEINVAVEPEVYEQFKAAGFNAGVRLNKGGMMDYSVKPVITFLKWATDNKGNENSPPIVIDKDKNDFDERIENGSIVNVQWKLYKYGASKQHVRPMLVAVQVLELSEQAGGDITPEEVAF